MARRVVAYLAYRKLRIPVSTVARHVSVGHPSVSRIIESGRALAHEPDISLEH